MQTDPVSAAHAYRQALEAVMSAKSLGAAQHHARQALDITITPPTETTISVSSGYGMQTQRPYVSLVIPQPVVQLEVDVARIIGMQLLEAAEGAQSDGYLMRFVREVMNEDDQTAARVLVMFRNYRAEEQHGTSDQAISDVRNEDTAEGSGDL